MPVHPLDFEIQAHLYSTQEGLHIFDEKARFQRWLNFEAALATSQAELGIIPQEAAARINASAHLDLLDLTAMRADYTTNRNSLVPLLNALKKVCGEHADYVHYGATTQDAIDTGMILELRDLLELIYRDSRAVESLLLDLAAQHRETVMIGRSHSQHALPITFGFKVAVWLAESRRHILRLQQLAPRLLTGQLSGAVGSMAALGVQGRELAAKTMTRLGLAVATTPWHTSRDNIAEMSSCFTMLTATTAKIANEIFQLGKSEVLELREPAPTGKSSGSSTMPHKRNPVLCERIVVMSRHVRALNGTILEGMIHENERDPRSLWSEWLAVPQVSIYTATSLHYLIDILRGLEVHASRMTSNLTLYGDKIMSEWLLFLLAKSLGKAKAQEKLSRWLHEAEESNRPFAAMLKADPELSQLLSDEDLAKLDQPRHYIGLSPEIVSDTIAEVRQQRALDPVRLTELITPPGTGKP